MVRLSSFLALLGGIAALICAPPAHAQAPAPIATFGHDDARDGTPGEVVSGLFRGEDGVSDPLGPATRLANSFETFPIVVPPGSNAGALIAEVRWQDPRLDLDIRLYRQRADGSLRPGPLASSAAGGTTSERATYRPPISGEPVQPGTYVLVVDNWCTRNADPEAQRLGGPAGCGIASAAGPVDVPDEDDFIGSFEFGAALPSNPLPRVTLAGPDAGRTTDTLTFTATAADDGEVRNYAFDLDGDGRFEVDNGTSRTISRRFESPGTRNLGVRVTDDDGGRSYASRRLTVTAPTAAGTGGTGGVLGAGGGGRGGAGATGSGVLLSRFTLNRPVFGGRRASPLVVRYRLREPATVDLALYRGARRVRTLARGMRASARTQTVTVGARGLRRGTTYTVYLSARTSDGRRQVVRLASRRL